MRRLRLFSSGKRLIAASMLLSVAVSSLEAVEGEARDGEVHHETAVEASTHATAANADHAHESAPDEGPDENGSEHEHGTATDHCTHAHGMALPVPGARSVLTSDHRSPPSHLINTPTDWSATPRLQPPRA